MRRAPGLGAALIFLCSAAAGWAQAPSFYRDIVPILQDHCQSCHRAGEIGPFPLVRYAEVKARAPAIARATAARIMPPWFAAPGIGHWANDPSLSSAELQTIAAWVKAGAPAGDPRRAPPPVHWTEGWNISPPDRVIAMPEAVRLPARGQVDYTYEIVPTGFRHDHWVQMAEIRPSSRANVHHAVVYVLPPHSAWLRGAPRKVPFTAASLGRASLWTDSDILLVYAPGSAPDRWTPDMGKLIPAGSELVFQMHYITRGRAASDQTQIGLVFNPAPPQRRVLTLQLTNDTFIIPPGDPNFRVEVHGTMPGDCTLLSLFPHMHLRGKRFDYNLVGADGRATPLLKVNYDFYWQRSYKLAKPLRLRAGTELQAIAWYDNSSDNPHNPDPTVAVRWGDQTTDEMMVGFFDVAVPARLDKWQFFAQRKP